LNRNSSNYQIILLLSKWYKKVNQKMHRKMNYLNQANSFSKIVNKTVSCQMNRVLIKKIADRILIFMNLIKKDLEHFCQKQGSIFCLMSVLLLFLSKYYFFTNYLFRIMNEIRKRYESVGNYMMANKFKGVFERWS
jgi:hypothetical protein